MSNIIEETTAHKQNPVGVEQAKVQTHAEGVTTSVEGAPMTVTIKEYVDSRLAQQAAKNGQVHAETQTEIEKIRTENTELHSENAELRAENTELRSETHVAFAEMNTKMEKGFAALRVEMEKGFAALRAENAQQRVEDKASQLNQLRWIVGTITAFGALIIASNFFN